MNAAECFETANTAAEFESPHYQFSEKVE